jgi:hypothetical protein
LNITPKAQVTKTKIIYGAELIVKSFVSLAFDKVDHALLFERLLLAFYRLLT